MFENPTIGAFRIDLTRDREVEMVAIHGSLADDAHLKAKEIFRQLLDQNPKRIVVDLEEMDSISSSGIGLLVSLLRRCRLRGTRLQFCGLNAEVLEVFRLARLTQVFEIFENRAAAMKKR